MRNCCGSTVQDACDCVVLLAENEDVRKEKSRQSKCGSSFSAIKHLSYRKTDV